MIEIRPPSTPAEWSAYYALRWQVLRAAWGQPPGSEQDDLETQSMHLAVWGAHRWTSPIPDLLGVIRAHWINAEVVQFRFMAVAPHQQGRGIGKMLLNAIESQVQELGASRITLNARAGAILFYKSQGYQIGETLDPLFGVIPHVRMEKKFIKPQVF